MWVNFRPLLTHLWCDMSSYFLFRDSIITLSGSHLIHAFILTCLHLLLKSALIKKIRLSNKSNMAIYILPTSCQLIYAKYKLLKVGTNRLSAFTCLSWFGFEALLWSSCVRGRGRPSFVAPLMANALGYSILTCLSTPGVMAGWFSRSLIQFSLIPRITVCQSHTPFIFQSPLPFRPSLFVCEG